MRELLQNSDLIGWIVLENLMLISLVGWSFLWQGRRIRNKKQDYEILEMMNQYYEQDLNASKERYDQISMIKHDMRNTLLVIENLLNDGCMEEAQRFLGGASEADR